MRRHHTEVGRHGGDAEGVKLGFQLTGEESGGQTVGVLDLTSFS
ncbi:hypothetical protein ABZ860_26480 [Microbispora sp. NPDC046973]